MLPVGIFDQVLYPRPLRIDQFHFQRYFSKSVGGAGKAGIECTNGYLDIIEQSFGQLLPVEVLQHHLPYGFVPPPIEFYLILG